ncbi:hypothetical protein QQ045_012883 [Rhodiola kirilowii]
MEYGFGAHEYATSGVFEVEPRSCPGFLFRKSILLGTTDMSPAEFRTFMESLSSSYHDFAENSTDYTYNATYNAYKATDYAYNATDYAYNATDYVYKATDFAKKSYRL